MDQDSYRAPLQVAFLLPDHFDQRGSWTGTAAFMMKSLQERFPGLYPVYLKRPSFRTTRKINRITGRLLGRTYNLAHSPSYSRFLEKQLTETFRSHRPDVAIAPAFSAAIAGLKTDIPLIYISDSTFRLLYGYYEWFSGFWPWSVREGDRLEGFAIRNSTYSVFASAWAARSALEYYRADPAKVTVIPFGANLQYPPSPGCVPVKHKGDRCRLIFIGMEWERKGGPIVMETFARLRDSGLPVQLDIVGCNPPLKNLPSGIRVFPFIDKSTDEGFRNFSSLMESQHFLFVPSRAECYGLVFAEASAYGLPSITTDTGGIPAVVTDGENGYKLPMESGPADYARVISDIYQHFNERYLPLSLSSFRLFQSKLNWGHWADQIYSLVAGAASKSRVIKP